MFGTAAPKDLIWLKPSIRFRKSAVGTGRGVRNRSNVRSARCTTSPTDINSAIGTTESADNEPSCILRSNAVSKFADSGDPNGTNSRDTNPRCMSPGVIGSTVFPHRYDAKSLPGTSQIREPSSVASNHAAASIQYWGRSSSRRRCSSTIRTRQMAGLASTTAASTRPVNRRPQSGHLCCAAAAMAPSKTAVASTTIGTARGVDRRDSPASVRVKSLNSEPSNEGLSKG